MYKFQEASWCSIISDITVLINIYMILNNNYPFKIRE